MKPAILTRLGARLSRSAAVAALGLGLVGSSLAGCATVAPEPAYPEAPALWVIRDADSTIYLFGTVHMLRPETQWLTPQIEAAFDSAGTIWFEITNPDDQAAAMPLVQRHGLSFDTPLSQRLGAADFARLDAAAASVGLSGAQMEPMRPWLAALTLAVAPLTKAGYDPASGVELVLRARAQAAGKPIHGLETLEQQLGFLAGFSEDAQLAFLRSTLDTFDQAAVMLDGMVSAWASGDVAGLERLGVDEMKKSGPEVYDVMLTHRNADWAGQIETMLEGSGVVFIAVGAAHLAGEDSVQVMLARRGVTVERLR